MWQAAASGNDLDRVQVESTPPAAKAAATRPPANGSQQQPWRAPTSRMSPPRMSSPRRAPAEVPTSTAVGAASPRAQGQAMTSTLQAIWRASRAVAAALEEAVAA